MRIAIAYNFNDHDWFGGRNYFASLFTALHKIAPSKLEMVLVMGHKTQSSLPEQFPWVEVLRTSLMDRMHPAWLARQITLRKFHNDYLLAWYLSRHGIDLLSHSGYLGPRSSILTLPWLYDFQFMHLPEYWTAQQIRWSEQRCNDACRYGHGLIVSSEDARNDLDNFAPWCDKPKYVMQFVSNPVDFDGLPTDEDVRSRYQLPARYFHLPNQFWSNKNHRCAIDALVLLKRAGINTTIACSGKPFDGRMPQYFDELMAYCRAQGVEDCFRVLGVVPHKDLQGLMAHSAGVINPSRFEGWSTTVEEAKTMGKRLLLSDIDVHKEQASSTGYFFNPDDPQALAGHITQVLSEPPGALDKDKIIADYNRRLRAYGLHYLDSVDDLIRRT